ncbi:MAG TPA: endolytic transglycosylase MltG [Propionicimonas sp.]|nr:endolytic transglycosylase MltG [Propionicimonas sp.]HRA05600.1 endolytic transglycosylase MltG [Propionicimonas sp.]
MSSRMPGEIRDPDTGKIVYKEIWYKLRSAFAVLLSLAVLGAGGWFVFDKAQGAWMEFRTAEDYLGEGVAPVEVTIPKGSTLAQISDLLVQAGVVKTAKAFDREAAANADSKNIQPGRYALKTQLPAKVALSMLLDPQNIIRNRFTLAEGKWLAQQWPGMAKASGVKESEFKKAAKDWKKMGVPTWAKNGLEGFLFPDTYELPDPASAKAMIKMATKQFNVVAKDLNLEDEAEVLGYTPYEVLVMASVIEKEAGPVEGDRAKIARVFYNRLAKDSGFAGKLQSDATVAFANKVTGRVYTTDAERALDSPWNTYKYPGLPKGPITSPSKKSIEAALHPADGDWTYFVVVNLDTGETAFANNLDEHNANAAKLQAWCEQSQENRDKCNGK